MLNLGREIAAKLNDTSYNDFPKAFYEKAALTAKRIVARKYEILERAMQVNVENLVDYNSPGEAEDIGLGHSDFISEIRVLVNGYPFEKATTLNENSKQKYVIWYNANIYRFNYWPRKKGTDTITIIYKADIRKEDLASDSVPIIPSQYHEELIAYGVIEVAKDGVIKFGNSDKGLKYTNAINLYQRQTIGLNSDLVKKHEWFQIETYNPL